MKVPGSWRRRRDDELDAELQSHLAMSIRDRVARGESAAEARASARREFGNTGRVREVTREAWTGAWIEPFVQDVQHAIRTLRRSPTFAIVAVLSLALGIGANTTIFGIVDALILRPLPVRAPGQLYYLKRDETFVRSYSFNSSPDFRTYQSLRNVFSGVAGLFETNRTIAVIAGQSAPPDSDEARVSIVSGNYFTTLGTSAGAGRLLTDDDDTAPGANPVAVVSAGYALRRYGGLAAAPGHTLSINSTLYTIVGTTRREFVGDWVGGPASDIWIPLSMISAAMGIGPGAPFSVHRVFARLEPGASPAQAQAALDQISPQLADQVLAANPRLPDAIARTMKLRVILAPAAYGFSPQRDAFTTSLVALSLLAALILIIACANIATLLLARSAARQRELAVRIALGAGRARILQQFVTESAVLASLGTALGLAFHVVATRALLRFVEPGATAVPGVADFRTLTLTVGLNSHVIAFAAVLVLMTGVLFGLAPALNSWRGAVAAKLRTRGGVPVAERFLFGKSLVVAQVGVSLLLLVMAGLFTRTLQQLRGQDFGYDRSHILLVSASPTRAGRKIPEFPQLAEMVVHRVSQVPGVRSAGIAGGAGILSGLDAFGTSDAIRLADGPPKPGMHVVRSTVTPGFFESTGVRLIEGRGFGAMDSDSSPPVTIVNAALARFLFGDVSPIGKHIGILNDSGTPREIIGVVSDAKYNTARDTRMGMMYLAHRQRPNELATMNLVVRTTGDPLAVAAAVRQEIRAADPRLPVVSVQTFDHQLDQTLATERLLSSIAQFFGVVAALLASLGLYGVVACRVARRTSEIGIRMALGATKGGMLRMIFGESATLVGIGILLGLGVTFFVTRLVAAQLYGVATTDPLTLIGAVALLMAVATGAALVPARRAATVDPIIALRHE